MELHQNFSQVVRLGQVRIELGSLAPLPRKCTSKLSHNGNRACGCKTQRFEIVCDDLAHLRASIRKLRNHTRISVS